MLFARVVSGPGTTLHYLAAQAPSPVGLPEERQTDLLALWLLREFRAASRRILDDNNIELDDY